MKNRKEPTIDMDEVLKLKLPEVPECDLTEMTTLLKMANAIQERNKRLEPKFKYLDLDDEFYHERYGDDE